MNTITAGDFTVELDISAEMYKWFLKQQYNPKGCKLDEEAGGDKYSAPLYLKKYLTDEIGRFLTNALKHRTKNTPKEAEE